MIKHYQMQTVYSELLERDVEITLLSNAEADEMCPLVIMHDGQNLFEDEFASFGRSWRLVQLLENDETLPRMRIIGLSNNQVGHGRLNEYSPFICEDEFGIHAGFGTVGGKGDVYLSWLLHECIPFLKELYPSNALYIGGSSMGGYISLIAGLRYPETFTGIFGLSNAWWFAVEPIIQLIEQTNTKLPKIYIDTGSHESRNKRVNNLYLDLHHQVVKALKAKNPEVLIHKVIKRGLHNEIAWEKRIADILKNLL